MSASETIFSKIIKREIPAKIVFESESILAFEDVTPQAPSHILVIPKKAISSLAEAQSGDAQLLGDMLLAVASIAREKNLDSNGYRVVINTGANAGQTVFHLHMHLLAGRRFNWPPG